MDTLTNIHISKDIKVKEYKLMYLFGAWITKAVIYAENDVEAIFDAEEAYKNSRLEGWPYEVALYCENRKVRTIN